MGKGEPRHVVRNRVVLVNICCFVSDPTSYNMAPGAQRATKLLLQVPRTAVGRVWSLNVEKLGKSDQKILIGHLRAKTTIEWIVVKSVWFSGCFRDSLDEKI